MNFYVTTQDNSIKKLSSLILGDMVLCENGIYSPVLHIFLTASYSTFCRLSNGITLYVPERMVLKTSKGLKHPELWDVLDISKELTPQIISLKKIDRIMFFHDILIEANMITPEGIVFNYKM